MRHTIITWFIEKVLSVRWIVNSGCEFGVRICGINCYYYKHETPRIDVPSPTNWRYIHEKEFRSVIFSNYLF